MSKTLEHLEIIYHLFKGRSGDITFDGHQLLDTSRFEEYQKMMLNFVQKLIQNRFIELGISKNIGFDQKRVFFNSSKKLASYTGNLDIIRIPHSKTYDISTLLHEFLHAFSTEWQWKDEEVIVNSKHKKGRFVQSGFSLIDRSNKKLFESLNEGVTELLNWEIKNNNLDEYKRVSKIVFENYKKLLIERHKDKVRDILGEEEVLLQEIKASQIENRKKEEERILNEYNKKFGDLDDKYKRGECSILEYNEEKQQLEEYYRGMMNYIGGKYSSSDEVTLGYSDTNHVVILHQIEMDFLEKEYEIIVSNDVSYEGEVKFVLLLIDILTYLRGEYSKESRDQVWKEIQILYFNGNILGLRRMFKSFPQAKNIFFYIANLDRKETYNKEQAIEQLEKYIKNNFNPNYITPNLLS